MTDEFRELYDNIKDVKPYCGLKVAIFKFLGKLRSWQSYMVAHALWYKQTYSYFGILESLSGASVDVSFISFDDILENGIPSDIDVIINAGDAMTAFSGEEAWANRRLVTMIASGFITAAALWASGNQRLSPADGSSSLPIF